MPNAKMSGEDTGSRAQTLYDNQIRPVVETDENIGKLILMDVETGDYEIDIDRNSLAMNQRMLVNHAAENLFMLRIGYDAVHSFGGVRLRPTKR